MVSRNIQQKIAGNRLSFNNNIAGRLGVSPYAVFLQSLTGSKALKGKGFEERGHKCAHLWYNTEGSAKNIMRMTAATMPVFPHKKYQTARKPPPFARWLKKHWQLAPPNLSFEEKTMFLAKKYAQLSSTSQKKSAQMCAAN
jgi:hypothetical protein